MLAGLPALRSQSTAVKTPVTTVISDYATSIDTLIDIDQDIALGSGDPALADSVRALGVISRIEEETSEQRAALGAAQTENTFRPGMLDALVTAQAEMQVNIPEFGDAATPQQAALYRRTVAGPAHSEVVDAVGMLGVADVGPEPTRATTK